MRRLMPMWASLIAVLLLLQWGGGASPCLTAAAAPTMVLCHVGDQPTTPQPGGPVQHTDMACPLCAPLTPALLPVLPPLHGPTITVRLITVELAPRLAPFAPQATPQQPRAPPIQS